ncbi:hypothetical protein BDN72DRAFT_860717 [Pluteus cervinus]|uniref:Uncharacterized protein n=1 Tax=Pluteus cervinus TaxID=181527 RepID=A0ACD3AI71_9AGAR|nr:hypothetical protein BDN72DRAFT_860717 [Pluteus cervinus]
MEKQGKQDKHEHGHERRKAHGRCKVQINAEIKSEKNGRGCLKATPVERRKRQAKLYETKPHTHSVGQGNGLSLDTSRQHAEQINHARPNFTDAPATHMRVVLLLRHHRRHQSYQEQPSHGMAERTVIVNMPAIDIDIDVNRQIFQRVSSQGEITGSGSKTPFSSPNVPKNASYALR